MASAKDRPTCAICLQQMQTTMMNVIVFAADHVPALPSEVTAERRREGSKNGEIVVINHSTLDGVTQSPGEPDEDTRSAFTLGGWGSQNSDEGMLGRVLWPR